MLEKILLCCVWFLVLIGTASAEPIFEVQDARLLRVGEDGVAWEIRHEGVYKTPRDEHPTFPIVYPIELSGRWYYAVGPWLVRFDAERGTIDERVLFPHDIVELTVDGDTLVLGATACSEARFFDADVHYRYNGATRLPFALEAHFGESSIWKDAAHLGGKVTTDEERRAAIAVLEEVRPQEPNNPFYDLHLGIHHKALGDLARADEHFDRARDQREIHWYAQLQLAAMLDEAGELDRADVVFDRAVEEVRREAPHFLEHVSLVRMMFTMLLWSGPATEDAVSAGDFAAVDRIQSRIATFAPELEDGTRVWSSLAEWYAQNGHPELAEKWSNNADRAAEALPFKGLLRPTDRALNTGRAASWACWVIALLAGVRSRGERWWRSRPRAVDLVVVVLLIASSLALLGVAKHNIGEFGLYAARPMPLVHGELGSPVTIEWLEAQQPSLARDALLQHGRETRAAYEAGKDIPAALVSQRELIEQLAAGAGARGRDAIFAMAAPPSTESTIPRGWYFFSWLLTFVILYFVGVALRDRWPAALNVAIPGASPSAAALSGVILTATLVALLAITGSGATLETNAAVAVGRYFGLNAIMAEPEFSRAWAWQLLIGALAVHAATVWIDRRRTFAHRARAMS